ncbi:MAG: inositol monophosphatase family protein, partial [Pirellulaceae bacterium]
EESSRGEREDEQLGIVEPLDGTNNFCHGIEHFAVSIAWQQQGETQIGVVYRPFSDDWFVAVRGQGAWHNDQPCRVVPLEQLNQALIGVGFYYDRGQQMRSTLAALETLFGENIHGIRRMGTASLDLCMTGTGSLGGYFEFELAPWDYAAGKLFVEEAGGIVTDCEGNPITKGNSSILASCPGLHAALLKNIGPYFRETLSRAIEP